MKKTRSIVAATLLIAVIAAATAVWVHRGQIRHQIVASAVPAEPDLSAVSPALRARLSEARAKLNHQTQETEALAELSRLYHANGFLAEAVRCYEGLEQLEPAQARWPHRHATVLAGYGEVEPALALWERVVKLAPDYLPARLRLADTYLKLNRPEEAAGIYGQVLQRHENHAYALLGLARIDFEAGRLEKARERLDQVVNQTKFELGYDLIVTVYERLGQTDRAQQIRGTMRASGAYRDPVDPWVDELLDDCFDPYHLSLAAGVAQRNGQIDTAIQLLRRAAQWSIAPDVSAQFQLGGLYVQQGDLTAALQQFTHCTTVAPTFADGWIQLGDVYAKLGDSASAGRIVLTGLEHCPDSPGLHLSRARQLRARKQFEAAAEEFKTSIRLRPNEADAYLELGSMAIENDRVSEGLEQLKKALEAEPENPTALSILAFHAISTGNESEARGWLGQIKQQPRVPREQAERLMKAYREAFGREL